jgi:hypothetical protein
MEEIVGEFCNRLLDLELQQQVQEETRAVRELILAKAFSESGTLEDRPPGEYADPVAHSPNCALHTISSATDS